MSKKIKGEVKEGRKRIEKPELMSEKTKSTRYRELDDLIVDANGTSLYSALIIVMLLLMI